MTRSFAFAALAAATLAPAAASAATYSASPVTPVAAKHIVARGVAWACGPEACRTSTDTSRPILLCQGFAKKAGRLDSFTVDGRAMAAAELDKCNSAARDDAAPALAAN